MKKQSGISLISLVVTIIVLIILAGVSINMILGENGIVKKAREAKQNMEYAADEEATQLNELYTQISGETNGSISTDENTKLIEFKREIASAITDMGVTTSEDSDASTMVNNIKSIINNANASAISYNNNNSGLKANNVQTAIDEVNGSLPKYGKATATVPANSFVDVPISVNIENSNEACILITFSGSGSLNGFKDREYSVYNVTNTGFTVRLYSSSDNETPMNFMWVIIGG